MVVSGFRLFEMLKARIGEQEAEAFVEILDRRVDKKFEDKKDTLATKEYLSRQIGELRSELLKTIYLTSVGQLIAIVGAVVGIILALKK